MNPRRRVALVLSGGGARAAYQVGVLRAISELRGRVPGNPFPILCGTSAGAINATALAVFADNYNIAVRKLIRIWRNFHVGDVYRAETLDFLRTGLRWGGALTFGWLLRQTPRSLLDNQPLADLLSHVYDFSAIGRAIESGHLRALSVSVSSYRSGESRVFFQGRSELHGWQRVQRTGMRTELDVRHLLASSAIPFVFPAVDIGGEYVGDGSMRQLAPIAPAIHLGADRVLVIGAGRANEPRAAPPAQAPAYPTLAQVAGHALSSIFLDTLAADIERTQRINHTLSLIPPAARADSALRPVELLVISPSQRLDDLALRHVHELPGTVRTLLGILGVRPNDHASGALASYLLFEPGYTRALMQLGWRDTLSQREEVERFFGWPSGPARCAPDLGGKRPTPGPPR